MLRLTGPLRWVLLAIVTLVLLLGVRTLRNRQQAAADKRELLAALQPEPLADCVFERIGEANDGGYVLCGNLVTRSQAAYSYGISGYDQWGCDISARLNAATHEYDCFDLRQPSCPNGRLMFHGECIGAGEMVQDGRPFSTLSNQIARNGDAGKSLLIKMDVEGAEWESLDATSDEQLSRIDQLVIEFHQVDHPKALQVVRRLRRFFHVGNLHFNNWSCDATVSPFPAWAYEVLFVNKRLTGLDPTREAQFPHPLDMPNSASRPDCQRLE